MRRAVARGLCLTTTAVLAALALPSAATAFQNVTIESGPGGTKTLHIVGDVGKLPDTVTITYDSVKDEYVITHDIVNFPAGCTPVGGGPPYKEIRCPQKGITHILVESGLGNDTVKTQNIRLTTVLNFVDPKIALFFPPDLITLEIKAGSGNDSVKDQPAPLAGGGILNPAIVSDDMGGGIDAVTLPGGGANTFIFGDGSGKLTTGDGTNTAIFGNGNYNVVVGNGENSLTFKTGNNKVYVGTGDNNVHFGDGNNSFVFGVKDAVSWNRLAAAAGGTNTVEFGDGTSHFTGGGGTDTATFGTGDSVFTGNGGNDNATFGAGANTFLGGGGDDKAKLGGGNDRFGGGAGDDRARLGAGADKGIGGPGSDKLFGGAGDDHLLGGAGFDLLSGGGGLADHCIPGSGGGKLVGCES
jgi:Ca2+-binding RTX toxin-like protein